MIYIKGLLLWVTLITAVASLEVIVYKGNADEIIDIELPVHFLGNSTVSSKNFTFPKNTFARLNITVESVKDGMVEVSKHGSESLVTTNGLRLSLKKSVFRTMEEMKEDPVLVPRKLPLLKWVSDEDCNYSNVNALMANDTFTASVNESFVDISFDGRQIILQDAGMVQALPGERYLPEEEGLILTSLNLKTCQVTYQNLFPMNQFGIFRNLNKRLSDFAPGNLIILVSLFDGSLLLNETSRQIMTSFGSSWAENFLYRDGWLFAFVKGGKVLVDTLIPNLRFPNSTSSPHEVLFQISDVYFNGAECTKWADTEEWNARRIFCSRHDGLGKLCDCEDPLYLRRNTSTAFNSDVDIPVSILTGGRTYQLVRLLETLFQQPGLNRDLIVIAMDGYHDGIARIGYLLGIKVLHHGVEGEGGTRISRLLKFSLFNQLQSFPEAKYFIQLEDDLVLAKDFYSYMQQSAPIFAMDASIWCVTGFNVYSFPHTSSEPSVLYRGPNVPNLGWMMPRNIIIELLEQWPVSQIYHNWDFFMALPNVNKGRECLVPDVIRVNHPTGGGTHFQPSLFMERNFAAKQLNEETDVKIRNLERLIKETYISDIRKKTDRSTVIEISHIKYIPVDPSKDQVYTIYLDKNSSNVENTSRLIHSAFGSWNSIQMNIWNVTSYHYYNATVLIICHPSPYSTNIPEGYKFYTATWEDMEALQKEETDLSSVMTTPRTHNEGQEFATKEAQIFHLIIINAILRQLCKSVLNFYLFLSDVPWKIRCCIFCIRPGIFQIFKLNMAPVYQILFSTRNMARAV